MTSRSSGSDRRRSRADPASPGQSRPPPTDPAAALERAKALALRVLAYHARSEAQLRARLARGGHAEVADAVVAWALRLGYLDDAAYARGRARALLGAGRAGPRLAERKLEAAGIPRAEARRAIAEALAAGDGGGGELALCREALARKLRGVEPGALEPKERARVARFLLGRGFSGEVVARTLRLDDG